MNIFKTFTFTWRQGVLFKWGGVRIRNCGRCLLAAVFRALCSLIDYICSGELGLSNLCVVEASTLLTISN